MRSMSRLSCRVCSKTGHGGTSGRSRARLASALAALLCGLLALPASAQASPCPSPALRWVPLAPKLWLIPAAVEDTNAANRGHTSNLIVGQDGTRLWLVGSGPSPAFARALNCQLRLRFGREATDVISPWPKPELVAGVQGLASSAPRHWGHADVAAAMTASCPHCMPRLAQRLGASTTDLGEDPIRIPKHLLHGDAGRLGPWQWWRLWRSPGVPVTVWQWRGRALSAGSEPAPVFAPGLIWSPGAADGSESSADDMRVALEQVVRLAAAPRTNWLGEQGGVLQPDAAQRHGLYWHALRSAAQASVERGDDGTAPAPVLAGLEDLCAGARHELNWQRTWRQQEDLSFQRNRR